MHTPSHLLFDYPQLRLHAVAPGLPFDLEFASVGFAADEGEVLKVSGLPSPRRSRRSAAKRPNSMIRVFSGCSDSANFPNRSRISFKKRRASLSCGTQR
jgi:hypothetical protein